MNNTFATDILKGLSEYPKALSSKYFYDAKGDIIFQEIMNMPSYYLTNCEYDIFQQQKGAILNSIHAQGDKFQLIELGAGDGYKTKVLLQHFVNEQADFEYIPVDISSHVLSQLSKDLRKNFDTLEVSPMQGDYFHMLEKLGVDEETKKVIMFLGSNIGNFSFEKATDFFKQIANQLNKDDYFLIGIDLKKDPEIILSAYNDPDGITARFNLNLLRRINNDLGADFDLSGFKHYPVYDPQTGECRSYLLSLKEQTVSIADLERTFKFEKYESIHTEISRKYSLKEIDLLADAAGFKVVKNFTDEKGYFVDSLWKLK
ncbi:L-histidine N(alpha)-methyltransferase [Chondrinema litorale]|uniref:L-histidine N(alpha)-methyltransferase n=1 Tax=Chondrinema litorale TaxID=2994555 RepID=UPI00254432F7|nr:L-histidine N(alpha)-methyltransferase [Chondrinema litorale]UZR93434.1 L-histidine N(alpha)-methyltransferase [Chondrinema litorale]